MFSPFQPLLFCWGKKQENLFGRVTLLCKKQSCSQGTEIVSNVLMECLCIFNVLFFQLLAAVVCGSSLKWLLPLAISPGSRVFLLFDRLFSRKNRLFFDLWWLCTLKLRIILLNVLFSPKGYFISNFLLINTLNMYSQQYSISSNRSTCCQE